MPTKMGTALFRLAVLVVVTATLVPDSHGSEFALHDPAVPAPVDPALIAYISDNLSPNECYDLIGFLVKHAEDPDKTRAKFTNEVGDDPNNYPCHKALTFWDEEFMEARLANPSEEKTEIGEGLLELALKYIQREESTDLSDWVRQARHERIMAEVAKLNEDMRRKREDAAADEKKKPGATTKQGGGGDYEGLYSDLILPNAEEGAEADETDEKERLHKLTFVVTAAVGSIVLSLMCFVFIVRYCKEKQRRKAYSYLEDRNLESQHLYTDNDESEWSL